MAATLSPASSPPSKTPASNPNLASLPPLIISPVSGRTPEQRPLSYAAHRMSSYSANSKSSDGNSRPVSSVFPVFQSSLPYALVRDFAYPIMHPLHYGPPPATASGTSTPGSESRRLSDPAPPFEGSRASWSAAPFEGESAYDAQLPAVTFNDGPPYSEDEDLHSPVVTASKHKKHKSSHVLGASRKNRGRSPGSISRRGHSENLESERGLFAGTNHDGSETYYMGDVGGDADGPGGELVTYPAQQAMHSPGFPPSYNSQHQDAYCSHSKQTGYQGDFSSSSSDLSDEPDGNDGAAGSRYSRDYQFTIVSPDEEMHGKAVALFDFPPENENELPLVEGQIIWVSYRHGQGWLVAEDPKTGESGLVPEEYVRLLRLIEGGYESLNGADADQVEEGYAADSYQGEPDSAAMSTPTQTDNSNWASSNGNCNNQHSSSGSTSGEKHPPVVSTFSTSSKDLEPYPQHLLDKQAGLMPPQIERKGSDTDNAGSPPTEPEHKRKVVVASINNGSEDR